MHGNKSGFISILTLASVIFAFSLTGCGDDNGTDSSHTIKLDGSSTVFPLSEAIAEEYMIENGGSRVTVGSSGTGAGFQKFCRQEIDIADASRPVKDQELASCEAQGISALELTVALDGIAIVVHPNNTWMNDITVEQLKTIWEPNSTIETWSDLNPEWPDETIRLYGPTTAHGTFDFFTEEIVGETGATRTDYNAVADYNVAVQGISSDEYALGYFGLAYYEENQDKLKLLGVDNGDGVVLPSLETVKNGTYAPLSRPLYIYISNKSAAIQQVRDFVNFYLQLAPEMAEIVGYIPLPDQEYEEQITAFEQFSGTSEATGE